MPFLYIYVCRFPLSLYDAQFQAFCITIFYVNRLYGVFRRSAGFYIPKDKNAVQRKFGALVTNNIFVIIVTLIITFFI